MEDRIYLVARSRTEEVNAGEIALALGGGGHPQAASATIKNKTLAQVERSIQALLRSRTNPVKTAAEIMSSPVIHIPPRASVKEAADLMTRYNINVLLVMEDEGPLQGVITRQIVEKAVFFSLGDVKVQEYMNIEFSTVRPDASLESVKDIIVKERARILPVVEESGVRGVITRTDLLSVLVGESPTPEPLYEPRHASHYIRKKNMSAMLKERLPRKIINRLKNLGQVADMLGYNAYLVGGLVRDVLLKRENLDVDVVIEGDGIKFAREFVKHYSARMRSHQKFGTAVLIFPDGFKADVATARMEYYEAPGAPPIVETSSLKMDLYRRDFTINTLAIKLNQRHYGTLIDYFGAQKDIKEKSLRVLHNLSFVEDPTRMLRAVRFEQRFGFRIGKLTLALMKNALKIHSFQDLAGRRFFTELKLILKQKDPIRAIERMDELGILRFISPGLQLTDRTRTLLEEIRRVIAWYNLLYLGEPFEPWKVYWHGLTDDVDPKTLTALAELMGMTDAPGRRLLSQNEAADSLLDALFKFEQDNHTLYTLLTPYDTETLLFTMARATQEKIRRLISLYFTKLKQTTIQTSGKDLLEMGFKPGPLFKEIFDRVLAGRLNDRLRTKEDEIALVKKHFSPSSGTGTDPER
jgi:tRNA nucleotidyltransferase (CCA-adding enzyme)